jgi:hypothetical protein
MGKEKISKSFNIRHQAMKFAKMVKGKIVAFKSLNDLKKDKK